MAGAVVSVVVENSKDNLLPFEVLKVDIIYVANATTGQSPVMNVTTTKIYAASSMIIQCWELE
jgi:hypothetical protein